MSVVSVDTQVHDVATREVTGGGGAGLPILLYSFQQLAVVPLALASTSFGMSATVFWMYVCAVLLFIIGLIKILNELPQEHGVDKIMPFSTGT